jgi:hypothetical protein
MGITFINPLFLFALAAGLIPVLIHACPAPWESEKFSAVRLPPFQQNLVRLSD